MDLNCLFRITLAASMAMTLHLPATGAETKRKFDYEEVARKVVTQSAAVKEGEVVIVSGDIRDIDLLEAIVVNVRKLGAFPLLQVSTDRLNRRLWTDVPVKYDSQSDALSLKMMNIVDAIISVDASYNPGLLSDIPAERFAASSEANRIAGETMLKRNVRLVGLGNGMYPTPTTAKRHGMTDKDLSRVFWDGVNVDYAALQSTGEALRSILANGKEVHVTNPNGTDLRFRIEGRPVIVSDGVMTPEKMRKGGIAVQTWLPAGEVSVSAVPGTAEGRIVADRLPYEDKVITGLTMTLSGGKMTAMTAKSGIERLKEGFDAAGPGRDAFGVLDIGINPNVRIPKGSRFVTYMPAGMVTMVVGNDQLGGGDNSVSFAAIAFVPGCTVTVDGKTIVENGALKL